MAETARITDMPVMIKAYHEGECRRISFNQSSMSYEILCDKMKTLFSLSEQVRLVYMDKCQADGVPVLAKGTDILAAAREAATTGTTLRVKVQVYSNPGGESNVVENAEPSNPCQPAVARPVSPPAPVDPAQEMASSSAVQFEASGDMDGDLERLDQMLSGGLSSSQANTEQPQEANNSHEKETGPQADSSDLTIAMGGEPEEVPAEAAAASSSTGGPATGQEAPEAKWSQHVLDEGQHHRLIVQTRLEQEWASLASDLRVLAVVTDVRDRLTASAQFTDQQLAQVCAAVQEALARVAGLPLAGGTGPSVPTEETGRERAAESEEAPSREAPGIGAMGTPPQTGEAAGVEELTVGLGQMTLESQSPLDLSHVTGGPQVASQAQMGRIGPSSSTALQSSIPVPSTDPVQAERENPAASEAPAVAHVDLTASETGNVAATVGEGESQDIPVTERDYVRYAPQLTLLADMGFTEDWNQYVRMLRETDDVNVVVNRLLEGGQ